MAAAFESFALRVHAADLNGQVRRLPVKLLRSGVVGSVVTQFLKPRDLLLIVSFCFLDRHDSLARADELFILIVEAVEAMAADAALRSEELLALIQNRSMLGDHVSRMALLAAGLKIFSIVERPEPVLVAAVPSAHGIDRAAVAAMAGGASKFLEGMPFQQINIRMARERSVCALGHPQIGLRQ